MTDTPYSSPVVVERQGYFYVAGRYDNPERPQRIAGQMYVEYQIPRVADLGAAPRPALVFVHGDSASGAMWQASAGGPGWADYFLCRGWPVYIVDRPGCGRSPYSDADYGAMLPPPDAQAARRAWGGPVDSPTRDTRDASSRPRLGEPPSTARRVFEQFFSHLGQDVADPAVRDALTENALAALLTEIGPAVLIGHGRSCSALNRVVAASRRFVLAVVAVQPEGAEADARAADTPPSLLLLPARPQGAEKSPAPGVEALHAEGAGVDGQLIARDSGLALARQTEEWLLGKLVPGILPATPAPAQARGRINPQGVVDPQGKSLWPIALASQSIFFVGGHWRESDEGNAVAPVRMSGQMYVRYQVPAAAPAGFNAAPCSVIMIHGGGQQGTNFTGTPDGRPGWADYFLAHGWPVCVVDQPGRGRSPYDAAAYGRKSRVDIPKLSDRYTATERSRPWPQAVLHNQWPGSGQPGDYAFDQLAASQYKGMESDLQEHHTVKALLALLEAIGPAVLLAHSASGPVAWSVADARPDLVRALICAEPNGPPFYEAESTGKERDRPCGISRTPLAFDPPVTAPSQLAIAQQGAPDGPDLLPVWLQAEPARKLPNLARVPIFIVSGEASYHAQYDHGTSLFLRQAGVPHEHLWLADVGVRGNGHMLMLEKNNLDSAAVMEEWLRRTLHGDRPSA